MESLLRKTGLQNRKVGNPLNHLNTALEDIKRDGSPAYIWGAAKYGADAYEYCKNTFNIVGFIDKRASADFKEFCLKPVILPEQFFHKEKVSVNVIIAVSYPAEVTEIIKQQQFYPNVLIFDGHSKDNPLLYMVEEGEICVPEYMNKLFAEWEAYSVHYSRLSLFIFNMFNNALEWVKKLDRNIPICEIGCGSGQFANMLFDQGYVKYAGIDFSNQALELARSANPKYAHQFICKDAFSYLQSGKKEDHKLFIMFEVLEHLNKDRELLELLPTGSAVILSVPNFKSFNHVRIFDSLESIKNRYQMLDISEYKEMPANQNADKVYHLVYATKI